MICEEMHKRFCVRMRVDHWVSKLNEQGVYFEYNQEYLSVLNMLAYPETFKLEDLTQRMWLEHRVENYDLNKHYEDGTGVRFFDYTSKTVFKF